MVSIRSSSLCLVAHIANVRCANNPTNPEHIIRNALLNNRGCQCDAEQGWLSVNRREKYMWTPDDCDLVPWDAASFCAKLGSRSLLMIGDSTMQQAAATVLSMVIAGGGACSVKLSSSLSDTLIGRSMGHGDRGGHLRNNLQH